ncbi:hypothetical protein [Streptomyces cadmiisoli]|uniref:hypothetical protein n=1 Tax=Streptomyces cadmiisoli TaxID=2184053 RepID=UPI0036660F2D
MTSPTLPTAPLPPTALDALASLLLALAPELAAARYRSASAHCRAASAVSDIDSCLALQDEMAMCHCQLAAAGRLDLIGAT